MPAKKHEQSVAKAPTRRAATKDAAKDSDAPATRREHMAAVLQRARFDPGSLKANDVLQLQKALGNRATGRLLASAAQRQSSNRAEPSAQRAQANSSAAVIQRVYNAQNGQQTLNTGADLRQALKKFTAGNWKFPNQAAGNGKIDETSVSSRLNVDGPNATEKMAVHATFAIDSVVVPSTGTIRNTAVVVNINNNHFTMRPKSVQDTVDQDGSSQWAAQRSAHCNQNGWDWGHLDNIKEVNGFQGATQGGLEGALTGAGYDAAAVRQAGQDIRKSLLYAVDTNPAADVVTITPGNNWQQ